MAELAGKRLALVIPPELLRACLCLFHDAPMSITAIYTDANTAASAVPNRHVQRAAMVP